MAFGGTIGYVILYFLWIGRVENVSACACVNVRVCAYVFAEKGDAGVRSTSSLRFLPSSYHLGRLVVDGA